MSAFVHAGASRAGIGVGAFGSTAARAFAVAERNARKSLRRRGAATVTAWLFGRPAPPPPPSPPTGIDAVLSTLSKVPLLGGLLGVVGLRRHYAVQPSASASASSNFALTPLHALLALLAVASVVTAALFIRAYALADTETRRSPKALLKLVKTQLEGSFPPAVPHKIETAQRSAKSSASTALAELKTAPVAVASAVASVGSKVGMVESSTHKQDERVMPATTPMAIASAPAPAAALPAADSVTEARNQAKKLAAPSRKADVTASVVKAETSAENVTTTTTRTPVTRTERVDAHSSAEKSQFENVKSIDEVAKAVVSAVSKSLMAKEEEKKSVVVVDPMWKDELSGGFPGGEKLLKDWVAAGATADVPALDASKQPSAEKPVSAPAESGAKTQSRGQQVGVDPAWKTPYVGGWSGGETGFKRWAIQGTLGDVPDLDEDLQPRAQRPE
uniref:Uncharacterized protein n=1 Tax=Erythrolobus australicus TaxID=1077150 RepID=A0A7S1XHR6_9RHOD